RTVWTLPPRLSGTPKRLSRQRVTLPCDRPACLLSSTTAAWASGPQLGGSGAEGVGGLQRMAPRNPTVAPTTLADVDGELAGNGRARDFDLELLGDAGFVEGAATVGAGVGQGGLVDLVDLLGAGRLSVGLGAIVFAGLAAGLLGLASGLAFGEGGSL